MERGKKEGGGPQNEEVGLAGGGEWGGGERKTIQKYRVLPVASGKQLVRTVVIFFCDGKLGLVAKLKHMCSNALEFPPLLYWKTSEKVTVRVLPRLPCFGVSHALEPGTFRI